MSNTTEPCCWELLLSHFEISSLSYLFSRPAALLLLGFTFSSKENVFLVTISHSRSLHCTRTFPSQRGTRLVSSVSSSQHISPSTSVLKQNLKQKFMKLLQRKGTARYTEEIKTRRIWHLKAPFLGRKSLTCLRDTDLVGIFTLQGIGSPFS